MTSRIVLLGATGYTGRLTAEALVARGARPVLAGRSPDKLAALAEKLGGLETARADVSDPAAVRALLEPGDVLVTTVGPFLQLGEPALAAAVDAGAIYLDSTGEPPFVRRVFEEFGPRADRATLVPAFGMDYVPGNLAGALALQEAGDRAHRLDVGYSMQGTRGQAFSRGTLVSSIGVLFEPGFAFTGGRLVTQTPGHRTWRFDAAGRTRQGLSIGGSEHLTLPALAPSLREVGVFLDWLGPATGAAHLLSPFTGLAARVPGASGAAQRLATALGRRVAEGPSGNEQVRDIAVAEVRDRVGELVSRVELAGPEPYGFTGAMLAWGATTAAASGVRTTGAAGPVQAFGLDALTAGAAEAGLVRA
ncbi:saccharopine dehydrogenase family protein [Petropleomorpha daqingensis]|uniref:Short subunit dehydrogenase-like uncharacterized protein n=1 Tax=Petropleomorpha daqingensis TaxID=2026353 RepID=A0A853CGJ4_9ACTN|nr:saccharopine dehydrogenase NADP-binding domain-containing protein [Petropleomorpha daqingensis]NYJ05672.1 short subunit dehydrogenase-like uncharacterized protein [Petropleomorpha daqingensis]